MDTYTDKVLVTAPDASQDEPLSQAVKYSRIVHQCQATIDGFKIRNIRGLAPDDIISMAADLDTLGVEDGIQ